MSQKRHHMTVFDAEKNYKTGKPNTSKAFLYSTEEDKLEKIQKIKDEQKRKNREFKKKLSESKEDIIKVTSEIKKPKIYFRDDIRLKLDKGTGNTTVIIGSSKSGKSTLMMYLFEKYYNKNKIISTLFSPSLHIKIFKKKGLIKSPKFGKEGDEYIQTQRYINQKTKNKYEFLDMFDDIIDLRFNKIIADLILTYRNSKVSTIINTQYAYLLAKSLRSNVNNVIFMHLNTDEDIQKTIDAFLKSQFNKLGYYKMADMIQFYRDITSNHGFMYFHPATQHFSFHRISLS